MIIEWYSKFNAKLNPYDITFGPSDVELDELTVLTFAHELNKQMYRKVSNAYCHVARIDCEEWLSIIAKSMNCELAFYYNLDGSGIPDRWRDYYIRTYSKDQHSIHPAIYKKVMRY